MFKILVLIFVLTLTLQIDGWCLPDWQDCDPNYDMCCSGGCGQTKNARGWVCYPNRENNDNSYDLQPEDLKTLCSQVTQKQYKSPSECVYMKWTPCEKGVGDPKRPCGYYQQTRCAGKGREANSREKREVRYDSEDTGSRQPVHLSFPDDA